MHSAYCSQKNKNLFKLGKNPDDLFDLNEGRSNISWLETFQSDSDLLKGAISKPNMTVCGFD